MDQVEDAAETLGIGRPGNGCVTEDLDGVFGRRRRDADPGQPDAGAGDHRCLLLEHRDHELLSGERPDRAAHRLVPANGDYALARPQSVVGHPERRDYRDAEIGAHAQGYSQAAAHTLGHRADLGPDELQPLIEPERIHGDQTEPGMQHG